MIRHIVFFSITDKGDIERAIEGLSLLKKIPHARHVEIARNEKWDGIDQKIDIVVYAEFDEEAALKAYAAHPLYAQSIQKVRPLRDLRFAADIVSEN